MSSATSIRRFGKHITWVHEPDIFFIRFEGDIAGSDLAAILDRQNEWATAKTRYHVLTDLSQVGTVSREARKVMNERRHSPPGLVASISYGASFAVRVVADMSFRARKALGILEAGPVIFVATEADAVAEVERYRKLQ